MASPVSPDQAPGSLAVRSAPNEILLATSLERMLEERPRQAAEILLVLEETSVPYSLPTPPLKISGLLLQSPWWQLQGKADTLVLLQVSQGKGRNGSTPHFSS